MALTKLAKVGYGQLELNFAAFRRYGAIEAKCRLADGIDFIENGMLLAVDRVNNTVGYPTGAEGEVIALNYTTEHMYDERQKGLKHFRLNAGEHLPRMGYQGAGDKYTTNCLAYDTEEFANDEALENAVKNVKTTRLYAKACANGAHQITKEAEGAVCLVLAATTMPDGQFAGKFQAL